MIGEARAQTTGLLNDLTSFRTLVDQVDLFRIEAYHRLDPTRRSEMGQYLTPPSVARLMASMFANRPKVLNLLDAGAGIGTLSAACIAAICQWEQKPKLVTVTAFEVEPLLVDYLDKTLGECAKTCIQQKIRFEYEIRQEDFITAGVTLLQGRTLFALRQTEFNCAILNPPYRKINGGSTPRRLLRKVGIETSNFYTAFLWLVVNLLGPDGELVGITPRSFCNGPYFRPFRAALIDSMTLRGIHVFNSRVTAFEDDGVLQENVILHAIKSHQRGRVVISSSTGADDDLFALHEVDHDQVIQPDDPDYFIHIVSDELGHRIRQQMRGLNTSLEDLNLSVSTGRVVDFRAKDLLRKRPGAHSVPLIYPAHFAGGYIEWPNETTNKPNALALKPRAAALLIPAANYVLVKRFSSKEEKRRVVAAVYQVKRVPSEQVGFENHLNYFHRNGGGLPLKLAKGLAAFLNSTLVDEYFRQFSGHTQVNATDLRRLKYPTESQLLAIGARIGIVFPRQYELDQIIAEELHTMAEDPHTIDPVQAKQKIQEALGILRALNVPRTQQNERSALTLLALTNMKASSPWSEATAPLYSITEMMDYFRMHFGVNNAPNTRETVRRQTIHQFVQSGLVIVNPDNLKRAVNSPDNHYQIEPMTLKLIRSYGSDEWVENLQEYLDSVESLATNMRRTLAVRRT